MAVDTPGVRLMVFLAEDDRSGHRSLSEVLLERAREAGMAGATVWRGIEGFGSSGRLRSTRFLDVGTGLPLVLEVIDVAERVEAFLVVVSRLAPGALVTREPVRLLRQQPAGRPPLGDPRPGTDGRP